MRATKKKYGSRSNPIYVDAVDTTETLERRRRTEDGPLVMYDLLSCTRV